MSAEVAALTCSRHSPDILLFESAVTPRTLQHVTELSDGQSSAYSLRVTRVTEPKALFVAMFLLVTALFFGAEYLYRFTWKRRRLKGGTRKEREQYLEDLRKFRNDTIGYYLFMSSIIGSVLLAKYQNQVMAWLVY